MKTVDVLPLKLGAVMYPEHETIKSLLIDEIKSHGDTYEFQKVESKENRAVIFSGELLHAGTSCTDTDLRVVLNIDYCKWN